MYLSVDDERRWMGEDRLESEQAVWREGHLSQKWKDEQTCWREVRGRVEYSELDNCLRVKVFGREGRDGVNTGMSPKNWQVMKLKGQAGARS